MDITPNSGIIKSFDSEKQKLISNRNLLLNKVQATNNKTEKVRDAVFRWLNDAEEVLEEEKKMETDVQSNNNKGCFLWRCSPWKHCGPYYGMQKKMKVLNTKCEFVPFYIPIPGIECFSSGNFECFKSTKEASDQLLEALQDDCCHLIGLHGMRGSGKTKLVKAVGDKAKFLKIFGEVVFITVARNSVFHIQGEIDKCIEIKSIHHTASRETRAQRIYNKFMDSVKRNLVILDDVQGKLKIGDIGIPLHSDRCKVLLTTHNQQICTLMKCDREIPLYPLSEEEAWKLFKKLSGIDKENNESSSKLLEVARKVAIECKGLPLTIRDVGYSLRGQLIGEWEATLEGLRHASARYQIFLSFRGEDTRHSFTGFLYDALYREGFKTFMDDGGLKSGDQISVSLIEAIEASRLSIIVLSKNYAYSAWCLDELVTILECKKTKNQLVWPIFYKVDPTDIRNQKKSYGEAMAVHEKRLGKDSENVKKWKSALSEIACLSGDHYTARTGYQYQFIQEIVKKVNNNKSRLHIQSMDLYGLEENH